MKKVFGALVAAAGFIAPISGALADADAAWINKCVKEIDREGNTEEVVKKWCSCMNGEMDENETLSILAWVKTGPGKTAEKKCDASSGWK